MFSFKTFNSLLQIFVFLAFLAMSPFVVAQVTIEPEDIPLEPGEVFPFYVQTDNQDGIEFDLGPDGEDRDWDFTEYVYDGIAYDTLLDPDDAPNIDDFPDANRVSRATDGNWQYEVVSDSGWYMIGMVMEFDLLNIELPIQFPGGILLMPMPAEYGDEWDAAITFNYYYTPAGEDTIELEFAIGGFGEADAWGNVEFPSGEEECLRVFNSLGIEVNAYYIRWFFGNRIRLPIGEIFNWSASMTYKWFAPEFGEIARITSMALEDDPDFDIASEVRVRFIPPELDFENTTADFGIVVVDETGSADLVISNSGIGSGRISSVAIPEEFSNLLDVDNELPLIIEVDDENTLTLLWTPDELGNFDAWVEVYHNDPAVENPLEIIIEGVGVQPPGLVIQTELSFGDVELGETALVGLYLENEGEGPGLITAIEFDEYLSGIVFLDDDLPLEINPGDDTELTLGWEPEEEGEIEGFAFIYHNDPELENPVEVFVDGFAFIPSTLTIQEEIDFGVVEVGDTEITLFSVENTGEGVGLIREINAPGLNDEIEVLENFPIEIAIDSQERITISWSPSEEGILDGILEIYHNDSELENPFEIILSGSTYPYGVDREIKIIPTVYSMSQNYPNPFNPTTTIRFGLKDAGQVQLAIFDINGRQVKTITESFMPAGYHEKLVRADHLASGIYFYTIQVNNFQDMKKMILIK
ncbi:MAG: choice-of-anchor D domain-containing protein [Candidatus Electryonea clarkiae]|nr:choice-of-anchor D domain-containing protein [Candidatus Electryonea clarkiae]MDP8286630.1 choice-of-anchor D domain-containing protein [Candidatus Electryonea clarkiae]